MKFQTPEAVIAYVKANKSVPVWVHDARIHTAELCALVNGEDFTKELISCIDKIESTQKAAVREKYARDIRDFFERLFLPIQNVFSSTGGVKNYQNGQYKLSTANLKKLISTISNIRDGKSIERYIESQWMNLYHTDPSGVLWVTYTTVPELKVYPTYHSINVIRHYIPKGQLTECIVFEPRNDGEYRYWTVLDDAKHWTVVQKGDDYMISTDPLQTYDHPFGTCPVIINSNIVDKYGKRLSPINCILPVVKEYARDQSVKTIYKLQQGFPKHWRLGMFCKTCQGTKKQGNNVCTDCNGKGEIMRIDVADETILPKPKQDDPVLTGDNIMGYSSPDLETWKQMTLELDWVECKTYETLWGVSPTLEIQKTATEIHYDMQPQINKLNKYADTAEWIEWTITEWCANAIDISKPKDKQISLIVYGRRYILEGIDTIQKKYEDAKAAGENNVVLDGIFDELLTVKFKNDPEWMRVELLKARTEPYLHNALKEIYDIFGAEEAARKVYFQRWWQNLTDAELQKTAIELQAKFAIDFEAFLPNIKFPKPQTTQVQQTQTI